MLKFMKNEIIQSARGYALVYSAFLIICVLTGIAKSGKLMSMMMVFMTVFVFFVMVGVLVNAANHFLVSVFKRPGYLTMTLPISTNVLLVSKLLVAIFWMVIASIVLFLGFILTGALLTMSFPDLSTLFEAIWYSLRFDLGDTLLILVYGLVSIAALILTIYAVIAFVWSSYIRKYRLLVGIVLYFAIAILSSNFSVFEALLGITSDYITVWNIAINLVYCGMFYAITYFMIEKRLQIE